MMKRHTYYLASIGYALLPIFSIGCAQADQAAPELATAATSCDQSMIEASYYWVCAVGDRNAMLDNGVLDGNIRLSELPGSDELIAVGPVEGLQGEITIYRGTRYISTIVDDADKTTTGGDAEAIFLAYGAAKDWVSVTLEDSVEGFDAMEALIDEEASAKGLDTSTAFPFRIEGVADKLTYHVIFATGHGQHNRAAHQDAKIKFPADGERVEIAGIWADRESVGRYTHPGRRSHMHAVINRGSGSGHIDALKLPAGTVLYLPQTNK